jgi:hypothetical protein
MLSLMAERLPPQPFFRFLSAITMAKYDVIKTDWMVCVRKQYLEEKFVETVGYSTRGRNFKIGVKRIV